MFSYARNVHENETDAYYNYVSRLIYDFIMKTRNAFIIASYYRAIGNVHSETFLHDFVNRFLRWYRDRDIIHLFDRGEKNLAKVARWINFQTYDWIYVYRRIKSNLASCGEIHFECSLI